MPDRRRGAVLTVSVALAAVVLAGCGGGGGGDGGGDGGSGAGAAGGGGAEAGLADAVGAWVLVEGTVPSGPLTGLLGAAEVTLVVEEGDQGVTFGGGSGCNQYGTQVREGEDGLELAPIAGTLMACLDPDVTALETGYLAGLERVTGIERVGERLRLIGPDVELVFAPDPLG